MIYHLISKNSPKLTLSYRGNSENENQTSTAQLAQATVVCIIHCILLWRRERARIAAIYTIFQYTQYFPNSATDIWNRFLVQIRSKSSKTDLKIAESFDDFKNIAQCSKWIMNVAVGLMNAVFYYCFQNNSFVATFNVISKVHFTSKKFQPFCFQRAYTAYLKYQRNSEWAEIEDFRQGEW